MSTYVISDIHGNYDAYKEMLKKIRFSEEDMLYILGDILDRGPQPIKVVLDLMERPNVVCLAGNHECMALECLQFLMKEITEESLAKLDPGMIEKLLNWQMNGSVTTTDEFHSLDIQARKAVLTFISEFDLYEEVCVNGKEFILVHAGLGNFDPEKPLWEYEFDELVWARPDYETPYFPDKYVITGHTPTMMIEGNPRSGFIFRNHNHIAIDCGAGFGGRLACFCLETEEEFYMECK